MMRQTNENSSDEAAAAAGDRAEHPYNPGLFDAVYAALDELEWLRKENTRIVEELDAAINIIREAKV